MKEVKGTVTIKEVAEKAGVAISTVSRVLNNLDRVSDETRSKVKKAADELGFVKNNLAASLKTGSTKMIIVVVPDIINEFYISVIRGVEEVAAVRGFYTLVFSTGEDIEKEKELLEGNIGKMVDGIVLFPADSNVKFYDSIEKPIVVVDRCVSGMNRKVVVVDNYKGSYLATERLIQAGHRDIGVIIGPTTFNVGQERFKGYQDAMHAYGIAVQEQYLKHSTWYQEDGYRCTKELMEMKNPPTAVYATNNLLCEGCIEALNDMQIKIGEEVSVIGFDDSMLARVNNPGITVITRATTDIGRVGVSMLLDMLEGKISQAPEKIVLDVKLLERKSIADLS